MNKFDPHIPQPTSNDRWAVDLVRALYRLFRDHNTKIDGLSSGSIYAVSGKGTAAPTTGKWSQGDFYANTNTVELGVAGSKYVIDGWRCVSGGEPGTWLERRSLTGN